MKKLFVAAVVAFAGLCFASCSETEDAIYEISDVVSKCEFGGSMNGDAGKLYKEFSAAIIAWDAKYASDWTWTATIKNGKYTGADEQAVAKFQKYAAEHEELFKTYQAKFDALEDDSFAIDYYTLALKLKRIGTQTKELSSVEHNVTYTR